MPLLRHFVNRRRKMHCALVILLAVCSLIVNVATRYSSPGSSGSAGVKTVQTRASVEAKRQHLAKDAANWLPPVICFTVLQSPSSYPRIAPAGPPIAGLVLEESLYNRPPPASKFLS
jgi:hypothetical protein